MRRIHKRPWLSGPYLPWQCECAPSTLPDHFLIKLLFVQYILLYCCLLSHSGAVRITRKLHLMSSPLPSGPICSHKWEHTSTLGLYSTPSSSLSGDIDPVNSVLVGCALQRCWDCQRKYTVLVWNPGVLRQSVKFGHYSCNSAFMFFLRKGHVCNSRSKAFLRGLQTEM